MTFPYLLELADKGWERALFENKALAKGLNVIRGAVANRKVAEAFTCGCIDFVDAQGGGAPFLSDRTLSR